MLNYSGGTDFMAYSRGIQLEDEVSGEIIDCAMDIARENGVAAVTVSEILRKMEITNRVFYNRFKNIDEVIAELYKRVVDEMRICIDTEYDGRENYYEYLIGLAVSVLEKTYETKLHFAGIMKDYDSRAGENRKWWIAHIAPLLEYGMDSGFLKRADSKLLAYSIWCYCRGFNASVVGGGLNLGEALESFRLGIRCLIYGLKPSDEGGHENEL